MLLQQLPPSIDCSLIYIVIYIYHVHHNVMCIDNYIYSYIFMIICIYIYIYPIYLLVDGFSWLVILVSGIIAPFVSWG